MQNMNFQTNVSKAKDNKRKYGQQLQKVKRTTNATLPFWSGDFFLIAPFPDACLLSHFYALVDVYNVCVTFILIDDVCF